MNKVKFILSAAAIGFAITLTLSCFPALPDDDVKMCGDKEYDTTEYSCDGGELVGKCRGVDYYPDYQTCNNGKIEEKNPSGGSSSSVKAGSISFNENSQVYIVYHEKIGDDGLYKNHIGKEAYKGNGIIEVSNFKDRLRAGSVTNGVVSLNLPANIPSEYLEDWTSNDDEQMQSVCSSYTKGIKIFPGLLFSEIKLTDVNGSELGDLSILSEGTYVGIQYIYFSKTGKIICSAIEEDDSGIFIDINAKEGWNRIYESFDLDLGQIKITTDNILTKEAKWGIDLPSSSSSVPSSVTYGGETYPTVVIGTQTWMAKNLNYAAEGSKCYDDATANCTKYGRLYDWATAKTVCPTGWHLPSTAEWRTLASFAGGVSTKLKAKSNWNSGGNGTDVYGFAALPGGFDVFDNGFYFDGIGEIGVWWSATGYDANDAYFWYMSNDSDDFESITLDKSYLMSVRCLKN